jgi:hypothetical protein
MALFFTVWSLWFSLGRAVGEPQRSHRSQGRELGKRIVLTLQVITRLCPSPRLSLGALPRTEIVQVVRKLRRILTADYADCSDFIYPWHPAIRGRFRLWLRLRAVFSVVRLLRFGSVAPSSSLDLRPRRGFFIRAWLVTQPSTTYPRQNKRAGTKLGPCLMYLLLNPATVSASRRKCASTCEATPCPNRTSRAWNCFPGATAPNNQIMAQNGPFYGPILPAR